MQCTCIPRNEILFLIPGVSKIQTPRKNSKYKGLKIFSSLLNGYFGFDIYLDPRGYYKVQFFFLMRTLYFDREILRSDMILTVLKISFQMVVQGEIYEKLNVKFMNCREEQLRARFRTFSCCSMVTLIINMTFLYLCRSCSSL